MRQKALDALSLGASHRLAGARARGAALEALGAARSLATAAKRHAQSALDAAAKYRRAEESALWMREYVRQRSIEPIPHHIRNLLARNWDDLDTAERLELRAKRGRFAVRCERCGDPGFFHASCPRCQAEKPLLGSDAYFWNATTQSPGKAVGESHDTETSSTSTMSLMMGVPPKELFVDPNAGTDDISKLVQQLQRLQRPHELEKPYLSPIKRGYTAYGDAYDAVKFVKEKKMPKRPYEAQSFGEANLHLVFDVVAKVLGPFLKNGIVPGYSQSILQTPLSQMKKDAVENEDREYFKAKATKKERAKEHAHGHRGWLRFTNGDVEDVDDLWKRGVAYCFDRSMTLGPERARELARKFQPDPNAARRHNHGHKTWLDVTSTHDKHATSGKHVLEAAKKLEKTMKQAQSAWCSEQHKAMATRSGAAEHLVSVVVREFEAEQKREALIANGLALDSKQRQREISQLEEARSEAADKMMRLLVAYNLVTPMQEAEYLLYSIDVARRCDADLDDDDDVDLESSKFRSIPVGSIGLDETAAKTSIVMADIKENEDDDDMDVLYGPSAPAGDYACSSRQLECIAASGRHRVRHGEFDDNTTVVPATLPFPKALLSGGLSAPPDPSRDEKRYQELCCDRGALTGSLEKSLYARRVLDAKRATFLKRGTKTKTVTLPFWTRLTECHSTPGQRVYSELFGQPMNKFFQPPPPRHLPSLPPERRRRMKAVIKR